MVRANTMYTRLRSWKKKLGRNYKLTVVRGNVEKSFESINKTNQVRIERLSADILKTGETYDKIDHDNTRFLQFIGHKTSLCIQKEYKALVFQQRQELYRIQANNFIRLAALREAVTEARQEGDALIESIDNQIHKTCL